MQTAFDFFSAYLRDNVASSDILERNRDIIAEFTSRAPKLIVMKCIDGRVHGSAAKGYPPTTVRFGRTDGNKVSLHRNNFWYWNRIDRAVKDAHFNTIKTPAMFIAFMHHSSLGFGCASHHSNNENALSSVISQMAEVRKVYSESELFVMGGDTDTDDMSETLLFIDGHRISSKEIISYCNLNKPVDVFHEAFTQNTIDDVATARNVDHRTPALLLEGTNSPFFSDFQICLNMQTWLLRHITSDFRMNKSELRRFIRPDVVDCILFRMKQTTIPESLQGPIFYQIIWNIIYALQQRIVNKTMSPEELALHLEHAEKLVCYGDGFENLPRNLVVLVKTGRGDDLESLEVAKTVIENNRKRYLQSHPPMVHINVEVNGEMMNWNDFNDTVGARVLTMLRNVNNIFGDHVAILTSYSYSNQKRFYPILIDQSDPRMIVPEDVISPINTAARFSNMALKAQEAAWLSQFLPRRSD